MAFQQGSGALSVRQDREVCVKYLSTLWPYETEHQECRGDCEEDTVKGDKPGSRGRIFTS